VGTSTATAFERATAVAPVGDGAWRATCDDAWSAGRGPNGGYLAAIVLRAMLAELDDPAREARSVTCHYLRPPAVGEVRVEVAVERAGRSVSTLGARLSQAGELCVIAVAAFARDGDGALDYGDAAPAAPDPDSVRPSPPVPGVPMTGQFESRPTLGAPPFSGAGEALSGGWLRFAEPQAIDAPALAMYADAWMPSPFPRLTRYAWAPTIDLTVHFRAPAATAAVAPGEPVLAVFSSASSAGGFFDEDGDLWSRDGVLLARSRQHALLVAAR
jgi:acyl-CoA thioesterase